jgi:hypothetical protein
MPNVVLVVFAFKKSGVHAFSLKKMIHVGQPSHKITHEFGAREIQFSCCLTHIGNISVRACPHDDRHEK